MPVTFQTPEARAQHPQASLISKQMWEDLFNSELDETILALMMPNQHLEDNLVAIIPRLTTPIQRKRAFIAIVLSHPELNFDLIHNYSNQLYFSDHELFVLLAELGKVTYLEAFISKYSLYDILEFIQHNCFEVFNHAAMHGQVAVLNFLESLIPDLVENIVLAEEREQKSDSAYMVAALYGHLNVLHHLELKAPDQIDRMICGPDNSFHPFRAAARNRHIDVCEHLMIRSDNCVNFTFTHVHEYGPILNQIFRHMLLSDMALANPLLHLFGAGAEGNNDYLEDEEALRRIAEDRESSMTGLTSGEEKRLESAMNHYMPILEASGTPGIMNNLRGELRTRYEVNPAFIQDISGEYIALPLDYNSFQRLNLCPQDREQALKAYYQHKNHSALRFISKPNHWMDPEADYIYTNDERTERWSSFVDYQELIALFWVAASDKLIKPQDKHIQEGRIAHFIDELALLGRAHNWDKTRINRETEKEEEYDDLEEGDKPSCYSGIKRRLFQSVIDHPLIDILTADKILEEIRQFGKAHFEAKLKELDIAKLKDAYQDYTISSKRDVTQESKDQLALLNISEAALRQFNLYLGDKYGAQYTEDINFIRMVQEKLQLQPESNETSFHYHAILLDGLTGFYQLLFPNDPVSEEDSFSYEDDVETTTQNTPVVDTTVISPAPLTLNRQEINIDVVSEEESFSDEEYLEITTQNTLLVDIPVNSPAITVSRLNRPANNEHRFFPPQPSRNEPASDEWDFDHPSAAMIILAVCIPVIGWAYLVYVLLNALTESCCVCVNDEENAQNIPLI